MSRFFAWTANTRSTIKVIYFIFRIGPGVGVGVVTAPPQLRIPDCNKSASRQGVAAGQAAYSLTSSPQDAVPCTTEINLLSEIWQTTDCSTHTAKGPCPMLTVLVKLLLLIRTTEINHVSSVLPAFNPKHLSTTGVWTRWHIGTVSVRIITISAVTQYVVYPKTNLKRAG